MKKAVPAVDRLEGKYFVALTPNEHTGTPCHIWTAAKTSGKRYPVLGVPGRGMCYVHRLVWEDLHGPLPEGPFADGSNRAEIHHICGIHGCINVNHLSLETSKSHRAIHAQLRRDEKARKSAQLRSISATHKAEMDRFFRDIYIPTRSSSSEIVEHDE